MTFFMMLSPFSPPNEILLVISEPAYVSTSVLALSGNPLYHPIPYSQAELDGVCACMCVCACVRVF